MAWSAQSLTSAVNDKLSLELLFVASNPPSACDLLLLSSPAIMSNVDLPTTISPHTMASPSPPLPCLFLSSLTSQSGGSPSSHDPRTTSSVTIAFQVRSTEHHLLIILWVSQYSRSWKKEILRQIVLMSNEKGIHFIALPIKASTGCRLRLGRETRNPRNAPYFVVTIREEIRRSGVTFAADDDDACSNTNSDSNKTCRKVRMPANDPWPDIMMSVTCWSGDLLPGPNHSSPCLLDVVVFSLDATRKECR